MLIRQSDGSFEVEVVLNMLVGEALDFEYVVVGCEAPKKPSVAGENRKLSEPKTLMLQQAYCEGRCSMEE